MEEMDSEGRRRRPRRTCQRAAVARESESGSESRADTRSLSVSDSSKVEPPLEGSTFILSGFTMPKSSRT